MKGIISLCVRRPVTIIMLVMAVLIGAVYSASHLPLDRLPEIIYPKVTVETSYQGMGAEEVRSMVTIPLEDSLSAVKGLEVIKSISKDGTSLVILNFRWGTVPERAAALVREAIDTVYPSLPHGVSKPAVISGDPSREPHAVIAVRSLSGDKSLARNLAEYELRTRLRRLEGAGAVIVSGGETQEIVIRPDIARLAARNLNSNDFAGIISRETSDFPAGTVHEENRELTVVSSGRPKSEDEISALVLPAEGGPLWMAEVAETARAPSRAKSLFIFDGKEQAALEIYKRAGSDPVLLSRGIKKIIDESREIFSEDAEISLVFDSSPLIIKGAKELLISGAFAAAAVIIILALFMGRLRYSFLAALALPFSAAAAVIVLAVSGRSLNAMSLGGLALGIGLVSDTSVIVLDLFHRKSGPGLRMTHNEAGSLAASVSLSSLAGCLTTIIVFVPVIFLPGALGALFGDLAVSLIVSVSAGWFYAQFCLPSLFCFLLNKPAAGADLLSVGVSNPSARMNGMPRTQTPSAKAPFFLNYSQKLYGSLLARNLRRPIPVIGASVLAGIVGVGLLLLKPVDFISPEAASEIEVIVDFPSGTSPENAAAEGMEISKILSGVPGIFSHYGKMGAETDDSASRADAGFRKERLIFRCLLEGSFTPDSVLGEVQKVLKDFASREDNGKAVINAGYTQDHAARILGLSSSLVLAVKGSTVEETSLKAERAVDFLREMGGAALDSISFKNSETSPRLHLIPRRGQIALAGTSAMEIAALVYAASEGIVAGRIEIEGRPLDIRVAGKRNGNDLISMRGIPISVPSLFSGENPMPVFLNSVVDMKWIEAETSISRLDRSDVIYIELIPAAGKEKTLGKLITGIDNVDGSFSANGIYRSDESVFARYKTVLAATVTLVLILLYLVLGAQFESFLLPLILMLAIPFSLAGVGPAFFLSDSSLDSGAVIGLIALFGLAVNNGIILYEIAEEKIRGGFSPAQAVFTGAKERFKPVLLTSLTTISALVPLVVSPPGNSQKSMALAMLGGIIASGFLAFFALPPVFARFLGGKKPGRLLWK